MASHPATPTLSTRGAEDRPPFEYAPARRDDDPLLTIVTALADGDPASLDRTAQSVLRQSLQGWEWVIVDDPALDDDVLAAVSRHEALDPRIRVVHDDPAAQATSPFVLRLASGDVLSPTAAEKWLWCLASHPEHAFVDSLEASVEQAVVGAGKELQGTQTLQRARSAARTALWRRDARNSQRRRLRGARIPEYLAWHLDGGHAGAERAREQALQTWRTGPRRVLRGLQARIPRPFVPVPSVEFDVLPFDNPLTKKRPRLLMIVPWLTLGGTDKFNLDLVAELRRRGWETTVVTTQTGDHSWLPELEHLTPDVFALSHFLAAFDYPRFLRYMIQSRRPDALLVMHSAFGYKALPYLRVIAEGRPILDFTHIDEHDWYDGGYARLSLEHSHELDLQVTATAYLKDWLVERGADAARIEPCHINIDPAEPEDGVTRAELALPEDVPILFYPCRLIDQKQPPVLAKTALELARRGLQFLVLIAGDGPFEGWLKGFVKRNGLQRFVRFLGPQPNTRVRQLMRLVDLVFLPSKNEGIAATFYEAMAAGLPVVGADVGGQRELVTPECGVLVERGTEDEEALRYADVLAALLESPQRRRQMGEAGRARILADFTLDRMGERMEVLLGRAGELAAADPRRAPSAGEARDAALEAVRLVPWTSWGPALSGRSPLWRLRVTFLWGLVIVGGPIYRLGLRLGFRWMDPLRQMLIRIFNPGAR